jgi:hypothetical protein
MINSDIREEYEAIRQEYETCLTLLESYFVEAIASGNWEEFDIFVSHFRKPVEGEKSNLTE